MTVERSNVFRLQRCKSEILGHCILNRGKDQLRCPSDRSNHVGFTLIEAMTSAMLLLIGLIAVAQLFGIAVSDFTYARSQSLALPAAQRQLEQLIAQYRMDSRLTSSSTPLTISYINPATQNPVHRFHVSWIVTNLARGAQAIQVTAVPVGSEDGGTNLKPKMNKVVTLRTLLAPIKG